MDFDLIILGSGPGGYVAAIRASQLGLKTAIVEKENLGGVCLNWGCIPTKALLKSAEVLQNIESAKNYGITINGEIVADFEKIIQRSRKIALQMSKGIEALLKKNNVTVINGFGYITDNNTITVTSEEGTKPYSFTNMIIATGARAKELPFLKIDSKKVIGYKEALNLSSLPESLTIIGSGAIGVEMAYFYASLGTKISLVEALPHILPNEDKDVAEQIDRTLKKLKVKTFADCKIISVDTESVCKIVLETEKGVQEITSEVILSAVGITANIESIGLENVNISTEFNKIKVDTCYRTNVSNIFAIGDVINTPALAHVASAEALACVEFMVHQKTPSINYAQIPSCIYTKPEVATMGMTEKMAEKMNKEVDISIFPLAALGKATAIGMREGFVKLIFERKSNKLLGATLVGASVTEMLGEIGLALKLDATAIDILHTVHAHPTISESIMEAAAMNLGEAVHI
ncbi:MAG: dihydrolipoyl dehydrogenase [Bacteroidales bacterium]|nr:dihydrolipoyl dehydrogenase [Bacteroidales bacterium]